MGTGLRRVSGPSLEDLSRQLREVASGRLRQRALGVIARELNTASREAFDNERSPSGEAWAPLKQPRPGGRTLQRTGRLRRDATHAVFAGSTITFNLPPYGPVHQSGTRDGRIPARPFLALDPLPPEVQRRIAASLNDLFRGVLR